MDRRSFLKTAGAAGSTTLVAGSLEAQEISHDEFVGCLTDTTRCIGCRACEVACAEAHGLPVPDVINDGGRLSNFRTVIDPGIDSRAPTVPRLLSLPSFEHQAQ